jgi:hypothetical protein
MTRWIQQIKQACWSNMFLRCRSFQIHECILIHAYICISWWNWDWSSAHQKIVDVKETQNINGERGGHSCHISYELTVPARVGKMWNWQHILLIVTWTNIYMVCDVTMSLLWSVRNDKTQHVITHARKRNKQTSSPHPQRIRSMHDRTQMWWCASPWIRSWSDQTWTEEPTSASVDQVPYASAPIVLSSIYAA